MPSVSRVSAGLRILAVFSVCMLAMPVLQAQTSDRIYPMEEVEIVSDRLGHTGARTGRHTSVIMGEELQNLRIYLSKYNPLIRFMSMV